MEVQQEDQASPRPVDTGANEGVQQIITPLTNASSGTDGKARTLAAENVYVKEIKTFFSKNLLQIIKNMFTQPIKGTLGIFNNAGNEAYQHGLILIATTIVFFILVPYISAGSDIRSEIGFGVFFKLGLITGLLLIVISALSFGIKAISGKPDFKKELLTGGLCGIPLMLMVITTLIFMLFNKDTMSFINAESLMQQGMIYSIILLYLLLMLFNIVQQSFKAAGTNDALSWYLSPLVICVGFYIGARIAYSLFSPSTGGLEGLGN